MMTRQLGKSDIEVSALGMGCWAIGGPWDWEGGQATGWGQVDDAESIRAIQRAFDLGVTFFDTAANYGCGHSERILGRALEGHRDKVVIATKFGYLVNEETRVVSEDDEAVVRNLRGDCENSLRRLNTDTIDLYQLHISAYDPEKAAAVRDALEGLVAEGKIRAYGWSTNDPARARVFASGKGCAAIQHDLNVLVDTPDMLALCDEMNVASVNRTPLARGLLTGKYNADSTFPTDDIRHHPWNLWNFKNERGEEWLRQIDALREVLTQGGRTLTQGALCWILARSPRTVPIPGFKTVRQVEENVGALRFGPFSEAQMAEIERLLERA